jgi:hypothetical protein
MLWNFFKQTSKDYVICNLCQQQLKYFVSTTNLKQNLIRKHPLQYNQHVQNPTDSDLNDPVPGTSGTEIIATNLSTLIFGKHFPGVVESSTSTRVTHVTKPTNPRKRPLKLYMAKGSDELTEVQKKKIDSSVLKMVVGS